MTIFGLLHFSEPSWVYVSIPIAAAVVGWFTKIVAVNMIFYPVEFKGIPPTPAGKAKFPSAQPRRPLSRSIRSPPRS